LKYYKLYSTDVTSITFNKVFAIFHSMFDEC